MGRLQDRIAVITGAGRGIGREIALLMAAEGAKVVVNDLGANTDGTGATMIADEVVAEIKAAGGEAVSNTDSVADVAGGERLVQTAIDAFGGMDILVNNAGILRDRTIFIHQGSHLSREQTLRPTQNPLLVRHDDLAPAKDERRRQQPHFAQQRWPHHTATDSFALLATEPDELRIACKFDLMYLQATGHLLTSLAWSNPQR